MGLLELEVGCNSVLDPVPLLGGRLPDDIGRDSHGEGVRGHDKTLRTDRYSAHDGTGPDPGPVEKDHPHGDSAVVHDPRPSTDLTMTCRPALFEHSLLPLH